MVEGTLMNNAKAIWRGTKVLAVLVVLALLYFVLRRIGFGNVLETIRKVNAPSIWAALLLYFCSFFLQAFRWQQLMKRGERHSIWTLLPFYMAGVFGNVITPGARVGGEAVRAYYMSKAFGGEKSAYLGTVLADKIANGAVLMVFLLMSVIFVILYVPVGLVPKILLEILVILLVTVVASGVLLRKQIVKHHRLLERFLRAVYESRLHNFMRHRFPTYRHFEDYAMQKLDNIFSPVGRMVGSPKAIIKVVLITCASFLLMCLSYFVLFRGLGSDIGFHGVLIIVIVSISCGDVAVSPGGVGLIETVMIGLCAAFGVDHGTAAAVTLMGRGIFYLYGLGGGGLCLAALESIYGRRH